jgi:hypothetical protein
MLIMTFTTVFEKHISHGPQQSSISYCNPGTQVPVVTLDGLFEHRVVNISIERDQWFLTLAGMNLLAVWEYCMECSRVAGWRF